MNSSKAARRSLVRVALATGLILLLPLVAMQTTDEVDWGVFDFALAGVLLVGAGLVLERVGREPGKIAYQAAAGAIGVPAILLGEADDAPGLVVFGGLLIIGAVALAVRTARRHSGRPGPPRRHSC